MSGDVNTFETKEVATVYCNQASFSLSYNDIRAYIVEISPSEVVVNPTKDELIHAAPKIDPKFSLLMSPEFARTFANALLNTIGKYESIFGKLRPEPTQETINSAITKK
jgi:hypothetical protein